MSSPKIPVGIASKVGYLLTLLAGAATAWTSASTHPPVSPETLLIVTIVAGIATNLGRQLQAATVTAPHMELSSGAPAVAGDVTVLPAPEPPALQDLPSDGEESAAPPPSAAEAAPGRSEAAVVPDGALPADAPPAAPAQGA